MGIIRAALLSILCDPQPANCFLVRLHHLINAWILFRKMILPVLPVIVEHFIQSSFTDGRP